MSNVLAFAAVGAIVFSALAWGFLALVFVAVLIVRTLLPGLLSTRETPTPNIQSPFRLVQKQPTGTRGGREWTS